MQYKFQNLHHKVHTTPKKKKKKKKKILDSRIKVKKNTGLKYHVIYVLKNLV